MNVKLFSPLFVYKVKIYRTFASARKRRSREGTAHHIIIICPTAGRKSFL